MYHDSKKRWAKYRCALMLPTVLCLMSCSTLKSTATSEVTARNEKVTTDSVADTSVSLDSTRTVTTVTLTAGEEVVTVVREYDTTQPPDSATGNPPLARETTVTRRSTGTARRETTACQGTTTTATRHSVTTSRDSSRVEARIDTATEESSNAGSIATALSLIGLIAIVTVVLKR